MRSHRRHAYHSHAIFSRPGRLLVEPTPLAAMSVRNSLLTIKKSTILPSAVAAADAICSPPSAPTVRFACSIYAIWNIRPLSTKILNTIPSCDSHGTSKIPTTSPHSRSIPWRLSFSTCEFRARQSLDLTTTVPALTESLGRRTRHVISALLVRRRLLPFAQRLDSALPLQATIGKRSSGTSNRCHAQSRIPSSLTPPKEKSIKYNGVRLSRTGLQFVLTIFSKSYVYSSSCRRLVHCFFIAFDIYIYI